MTYTTNQISKAKSNYISFLRFGTAQNESCYTINPFEAERRSEFHNSLVSKIQNGNKELEREWKLFFLTEEVKHDQKAANSKAKLQANKDDSSDILAPVKSLKKLGEFGKWLNNSSNQYRKQHFNKYYTIEAVNAFLETL